MMCRDLRNDAQRNVGTERGNMENIQIVPQIEASHYSVAKGRDMGGSLERHLPCVLLKRLVKCFLYFVRRR
jgi:hypothetical protein